MENGRHCTSAPVKTAGHRGLFGQEQFARALLDLMLRVIAIAFALALTATHQSGNDDAGALPRPSLSAAETGLVK